MTGNKLSLSGSPATPRRSLTLKGIWFTDGHRIALWDDTSRRHIAKARADLQNLLLPVLNPACTHVKWRGGLKRAIRDIHTNLPHYPFVARFDVKSYYDTMDHAILLSQLDKITDVPQDLRETVRQYLEEPDTIQSGTGLSAGGSLSPLLAALYLQPLDDVMQDLAADGSIFYRRFMDDFVILARTRWRLRSAIRKVHQVLASLGMCVHETKRFIGRSSAGFDFLGYHLDPARRLRPSTESVRRLKERARRHSKNLCRFFSSLCFHEPLGFTSMEPQSKGSGSTLPDGVAGCGAGSIV